MTLTPTKAPQCEDISREVYRRGILPIETHRSNNESVPRRDGGRTLRLLLFCSVTAVMNDRGRRLSCISSSPPSKPAAGDAMVGCAAMEQVSLSTQPVVAGYRLMLWQPIVPDLVNGFSEQRSTG